MNSIELSLPSELQQATLSMVKDALKTVVDDYKEANSYPPYMNQRSAAKYLGVSPSTVIRWERTFKDFPIIEIDGTKKYKKTDLDNWMNKHKK